MPSTNMYPNPARTPGLVPVPEIPMSRQARASIPVTQSCVSLGFRFYLPSFPPNCSSAPGSLIRIRFLWRFAFLLTTSSIRSKSVHFAGTEYLDTVTLGPGLAIENQSIGVATFVSSMTMLPVTVVDGLHPVARSGSRRDPRVCSSVRFFLEFRPH